jgi:hypothetical protein
MDWIQSPRGSDALGPVGMGGRGALRRRIADPSTERTVNLGTERGLLEIP